jgi:Replication initiator protein A
MIGTDAFTSWFQGARYELVDDKVKVVAGTTLAARVITQNYVDAVRSAATEVAGHPIVSATVVVDGEEQATEVAPIEKILRAVAPDDAQPDFFIPELSEVALKDDVHLMEMTPFTLNGRNETRRELVYTSPQGLTLRVKAAEGEKLPTVEDYDLVLMMQSWLADMANQYKAAVERYEADRKAGLEVKPPAMPPRTFEVSISEVVKFKRAKWGGHASADVVDGLRRLASTAVSIDSKKRSKYRGGIFHLTGRVDVLAQTDEGKATRVAIEIPDWIYQGIVERAVPMLRTFSRDYLILAQPMHRALYRLLSLKVPKDGKPYMLSLSELAQRFQTRAEQKYFNRDLKKAVDGCGGQLLEYRIQLIGKGEERSLQAWRPIPIADTSR